MDVSQSVHIDKMKELSKELTTGCSMCLEKLVLCAQVLEFTSSTRQPYLKIVISEKFLKPELQKMGCQNCPREHWKTGNACKDFVY